MLLLGFDEGQKIGIELIFVGGGQSMRSVLVGLQRRVLDEFS